MVKKKTEENRDIIDVSENTDNELAFSEETDELDNLLIGIPENSSEKEILMHLTSNDDLDTKSEVNETFKYTMMDMYGNILENAGLKKSALLVRNFKTKMLLLKISKNRMGKKELLEALKSIARITEREVIDNPIMKSD